MIHMPMRSAATDSSPAGGRAAVAALCAALALAGCAGSPAPATSAGPAATTLANPATLPGWSDDDLSGLYAAIDRQCALVRAPAPWPRLCPEFRERGVRLRDWLEQRFRAQPIAGADGAREGLVTGYHEPELSGSRLRASPDQVPLYRRPPEQVLRARPTRAQIEDSAMLAGSELVWLDDPVEAFFLQVQGSGRIRLRDGGTMRVGYAGDNGHAYRAIGQVLVARGAMRAADVDAGSIKAWLRANPRDARQVMRANPRFIFFRELADVPADTGPPGALGVPLTPLRSVAVDPAHVPAGALLFLDTTDPVDGRALRRVVVAQDTGAAIVGAVRADLFWGKGPGAELAAGRMKQRGRLWRLLPAD